MVPSCDEASKGSSYISTVADVVPKGGREKISLYIIIMQILFSGLLGSFESFWEF